MATTRAPWPAGIGGDPALDLCNTVAWRTAAEPTELLGDYLDWLGWCEAHGAATNSAVAELTKAARRNPDDATDAFDHVTRARAILTAVFDPLARGAAPGSDVLEALRLEYLIALGRAQLNGGADIPRLDWPATAALDAPLSPLIASGWSLLLEPDRPRLAICAGAGCGWLFLDRSKNGSRRWCATTDCGRRERVRRHRASAPSGGGRPLRNGDEKRTTGLEPATSSLGSSRSTS